MPVLFDAGMVRAIIALSRPALMRGQAKEMTSGEENAVFNKSFGCALVALFVVVLGLAPRARADNLPTTLTLADLLAGQSIIVGDKEFYDFHGFSSVVTGNATAVNPADVTVEPYISGGEYGVRFSTKPTGTQFFASAGSSQDTSLEFWVRALAPGWYISGSSMTLDATATPDSRAMIVEVARTSEIGGSQLAGMLVLTSDGLTDHVDFSQYVKQVHVQKDIAVDGRNTGSAQVNAFTQSFEQVSVPLPGMAWTTLGLLGGLAGWRLRRRSH